MSVNQAERQETGVGKSSRDKADIKNAITRVLRDKWNLVYTLDAKASG